MTVNPFGDMFGDIFSMLSQQGPDAWYTTATQLALNIARGEDGDPNPLPIERQRLEELAPLVGRHVDALFGVSSEPGVVAVNRSALTVAALEQWRPLMNPMVTSAPPTAPGDELDDTDANSQLMAQISSTIGPLFAGFQMGSVAGHFSARAWSLAVLPLPRQNDQHLLVVNNLANFASEWSLERDEVYVFALAQEFVASLVLAQPGTGDALRALLIDTVNEANAIQGDLMGRLQGLMESGDINDMMSHPESLLDGIEVPEESDATRAINAAASVLLAFFGAAAHDITEKLLGPRPTLAEAYARHRRSDARGEDAAAALFGISTQGPHHDAATEFVSALAAKHTLSVFGALLRVDGLPSAAELNDPDAWYERVTNSPLA
ncbi:MAG TPA: zinc-dependent metalloprotease [Acidimicrobiales bacterium]|nr:zinc-dependent metalloprotease [Acidimicrobiales bacterium]